MCLTKHSIHQLLSIFFFSPIVAQQSEVFPVLVSLASRSLSVSVLSYPLRYLQRVVTHPSLIQEPDVREFLEREEVRESQPLVVRRPSAFLMQRLEVLCLSLCVFSCQEP